MLTYSKKYPGYAVDENGNVYGLRGKPLNPFNISGYKRVHLRCGPVRVHRLVAETLLPNPHDKPFVNHIDGDKTNNHPSNLEWVTDQENKSHALATGLWHKVSPRRDSETIEEALSDILNGASTTVVCTQLGVRPSNLNRMLKRRLSPDQYNAYCQEISSRGKVSAKDLEYLSKC